MEYWYQFVLAMIKDDILSAAKHGEQLLENFKTDAAKELSERSGNINTTERYVVMCRFCVSFSICYVPIGYS